MRRRRLASNSVTSTIALVLALVVLIVGARLLGARSSDRASAEAEARVRAAGFANRLQVVDMLEVPLTIEVRDVDPAQWGQSPPDDEPPAGLQGAVVGAGRVGSIATIRPLRLVDGGGEAGFTIALSSPVGPAGARVTVATVPTVSRATEYCPPNGGDCFEGWGWFDWPDPREPELDAFRQCTVDERVVGGYIDASGAKRSVRASFQCDATRFMTWLVLRD